MQEAYPKYPALFILLIFLLCSNCTPSRLHLVEGERYNDPQGYFELSIPWLKSHLQHNGWQLLSWKKVNFVLWDSRTGATIVVDVNPLKEDLDLVTLTNHLLIAFEDKRIISRDTEKIDGREALKTALEAWVERTEITAEVYVVRGRGPWGVLSTIPRSMRTSR